MNVDKNFYPGWVRRAITFTIDDGSLVLDRKLIDKIKPYGIKGTFNIPTVKGDPGEYLKLYRGYGISNHCKLHPYAFGDDTRYILTSEPFDSDTADPDKCYATEREGVYRYHVPKGWRTIASADAYLKLAEENLNELYEIFGKENVHGYCWPYSLQRNAEVVSGIRGMHEWVRGSGYSGSFDVPKDRSDWHYTANYKNLAEESEKYEALADDGELKFFCFGVHSFDFENNGCWNILEDFVRKFGNRPEDYYYADNHTIFTYADAVRDMRITDSGIDNPSDHDLYIKIEGNRRVIPKHSFVNFEDIE